MQGRELCYEFPGRSEIKAYLWFKIKQDHSKAVSKELVCWSVQTEVT